MPYIRIMKKEIWVNIRGFKGYYQVSNYGRIKGVKRRCKHKKGTRHVPEKILSPSKNEYGYRYVGLSANNVIYMRRVNRLVAKAFHPNPKRLPEVNHIDGDKDNNRSDNLEWSTISDNRKHAWRLGLNKGRYKCIERKFKKTG